MSRARPLWTVVAVLALAGCSTKFSDQSASTTPLDASINEVQFRVTDAYRAQPPDCVAILPFTVKTSEVSDISPEDAADIRKSFFAHLSTQSKREIRLERVDHTFAEVGGDIPKLGESLKCGAVITGEVTHHGTTFLGIYSRVSVGMTVKMTRASDGTVLWEAQHVAMSHGGSVPLDPVGAAMGLASAVNNAASDDTMLRVVDDLTRRLVATVPDDKVVPLDDPGATAPKAAPPDPTTIDGFLAMVAAKPPAEQRTLLIQAVSQNRFVGSEGQRAVDALLALAPTDAEAQTAVGTWRLAGGDLHGAMGAADQAVFLDPKQAAAHYVRARVLLLGHDAVQAEPAILKAVALDQKNPRYLDALGAVSAARGANQRALAAYSMAIQQQPADGFAWYNSAIIHFNAGNTRDAADAFYAAGLAYIKAGDAIHAEKAINDLKDLQKNGASVDADITTLENALAGLARRKS